MWQQIAVGSVLVIATTLAHGAGTVLAMRGLSRVTRVHRTYIGRGLVISGLVLAMFLLSIADALLWAYAYVQVGAIPDREAAMYFSMVTFTTLGYGDITRLPSVEVKNVLSNTLSNGHSCKAYVYFEASFFSLP